MDGRECSVLQIYCEERQMATHMWQIKSYAHQRHAASGGKVGMMGIHNRGERSAGRAENKTPGGAKLSEAMGIDGIATVNVRLC